LTNDSLEEFLREERPSESKVRWINVDGISWDVIKVLSIHFGMSKETLTADLHDINDNMFVCCVTLKS